MILIPVVKKTDILKRKMKNKIPKILWHHGTCDVCNERFTLVCHFNYDKQPKRDFRICLKCFRENIEEISFGWMNYEVDKTIDKSYSSSEEIKEGGDLNTRR